VLNVIHGYGSSGRGGALCIGLRKSFRLRKKEGIIKEVIDHRMNLRGGRLRQNREERFTSASWPSD
jgi:hypothetical protein